MSNHKNKALAQRAGASQHAVETLDKAQAEKQAAIKAMPESTATEPQEDSMTFNPATVFSRFTMETATGKEETAKAKASGTLISVAFYHALLFGAIDRYAELNKAIDALNDTKAKAAVTKRKSDGEIAYTLARQFGIDAVSFDGGLRKFVSVYGKKAKEREAEKRTAELNFNASFAAWRGIVKMPMTRLYENLSPEEHAAFEAWLQAPKD